MLKNILMDSKPTFGKVIATPINDKNVLVLDFSANNFQLHQIDLRNTSEFNRYVFELIENAKADVGVGGYGENRIIYKRSTNYEGEEPRSIHLGIDIWMKAYKTVYTPLDAKVHSVADNQGFGNYGPTIILEHLLSGKVFYTLYGHMSLSSLYQLKEGMIIKKGEEVGEIGDYPENGDWPPHLHFQVIENLEGHHGDYPGVAAPSESEKYLANCPDPNLILGIEKLRKFAN